MTQLVLCVAVATKSRAEAYPAKPRCNEKHSLDTAQSEGVSCTKQRVAAIC